MNFKQEGDKKTLNSPTMNLVIDGFTFKINTRRGYGSGTFTPEGEFDWQMCFSISPMQKHSIQDTIRREMRI